MTHFRRLLLGFFQGEGSSPVFLIASLSGTSEPLRFCLIADLSWSQTWAQSCVGCPLVAVFGKRKLHCQRAGLTFPIWSLTQMSNYNLVDLKIMLLFFFTPINVVSKMKINSKFQQERRPSWGEIRAADNECWLANKGEHLSLTRWK